MNPYPETTEDLELDILLETIHRLCGYDFRQYSKASLARGVKRDLATRNMKHISELIPVILHDQRSLNTLIHNLSVNVTEFFREPAVFQHLVSCVFPALQSFPFIKIWHAGCSVGKEVYSLAVLLQEYGLLSRCLIYATDFNHSVLSVARNAVYCRDEIDATGEKYQSAGGQRNFSDYFHSQYNVAKVDSVIRERITFAHHNLATDGVFAEVQLIFCTNVLIYFNKDLKTRVLSLFQQSLCPSGFLLLGPTEILYTGAPDMNFTEMGRNTHLYKKTPALNTLVNSA